MRPNSVLLKRKRKLRGWSQAFVADAAGLSRRTVQNIETDTGGVKASSIYALADVLSVEHSDAVIANQELIDNGSSFAVWPWRLFEFLGKRLLPHEHTFIRSRSEAESVVEKVWSAWQLHLANMVKAKSVRRSAIDKWNREDFIERYLGIWERNPETLMCSSIDGHRSGVSILLPVSSTAYEAFLLGEISSFDIRAEHLADESQNLVYDAIVEFDEPLLKRSHRITKCLSFVSFYQLATLSINTATADFRLTTFGGAEENSERIANAGLIKTDFRTPDFGDVIWEYSGEFGSKKSRFAGDEIERSATGAHYVAMMKRWASARVRDRIRAETGRKAIRVYQQLLSSARRRTSEYRKAG